MEWWQIIISIISIVGVGFMLVRIWDKARGKNRKEEFWEEDANYQSWGDVEGMEPVDDWDKKRI